jgi:hypothetical protein
MIFFVISLQEGFYAYQFKNLGWTILSIITILTGLHGNLSGLWRCRVWFFYAVTAVTLRNGAEYLVEKFSPYKTQLLSIKPQSSW